MLNNLMVDNGGMNEIRARPLRDEWLGGDEEWKKGEEIRIGGIEWS